MTKELKRILREYLNDIRDDLMELCEDNRVMKDTINEYFTDKNL